MLDLVELLTIRWMSILAFASRATVLSVKLLSIDTLYLNKSDNIEATSGGSPWCVLDEKFLKSRRVIQVLFGAIVRSRFLEI